MGGPGARPAYMDLHTYGEWKRYIQHLIRTNDKALVRAVLAIYRRQTPQEKASKASTEDNGVGFTKWDAEEMTEIAKAIESGVPLKNNQMVHARLVMPKYWRQLAEISKQTVARIQQKEYDTLMEQRRQQFAEVNQEIRKCIEDGIPCQYGICDECIARSGVQTRLGGV